MLLGSELSSWIVRVVPQSLSHRSCYGPGMRRYPDDSDPGTLLASFGEARLIQQLDTRFELVRGTEADRTAATDWLRRSLPEARLGQRNPMPWPRTK